MITSSGDKFLIWSPLREAGELLVAALFEGWCFCVIKDDRWQCELVNLNANLCDFFGFQPVYLNFNRYVLWFRLINHVQHTAVYTIIIWRVRYIEKLKGAYLFLCLSAPTKSEDEMELIYPLIWFIWYILTMIRSIPFSILQVRGGVVGTDGSRGELWLETVVVRLDGACFRSHDRLRLGWRLLQVHGWQ